MGLISYLCRSNLKVVDPHSLNPREQIKKRSTYKISDNGSESNEVRPAGKVYPEEVRFDHQLDISFLSTVESYRLELFKDSSIFKGAEKDIIVTEHISPTILSKFEESFESSQYFAFVCFKSMNDDFLWVIRKCIMNETMHSNLALSSSKWSDCSGKEFQLFGGGEIRKIDDRWSLYPKTGNLCHGGYLEVESLDENVEELAIKNGLNFIPYGSLAHIEENKETIDDSNSYNWMPSDEVLNKNGLICIKELLNIAQEGEEYDTNIMKGLTTGTRVWNYEKDIIQSEQVKLWQKLDLNDEFLMTCLDEIIQMTMDFHSCQGILKYALLEINNNFSK